MSAISNPFQTTWSAHANADHSTLYSTTCRAFIAFVLLVAHTSHSSESSSIAIGPFRVGSSNMAFAGTNTSATNLSSQPGKGRAIAGLVESNGMYSIYIQMDPPEEVLPVGTFPMPLDMKQALAIYAELTGAELEIADNVRQFRGLLRFPKEYPPMTRTQACELFETTLREQAGVEVIHPDTKHAVLRFRKQTPQ
jgi:hypothetical protein